MISCVFPGSFDPLTNGHYHIIQRASTIFDHVTIAVMVNISKTGCIPFEERVRIIKKACYEMKNISVELWDGLLADFMRTHHEKIIIRGVRTIAEYEHELQSASLNKKLNPAIETLLIPAEPHDTDISSSAIREIAYFGGDYRSMVPREIYEDVKIWIGNQQNR